MGTNNTSIYTHFDRGASEVSAVNGKIEIKLKNPARSANHEAGFGMLKASSTSIRICAASPHQQPAVGIHRRLAGVVLTLARISSGQVGPGPNGTVSHPLQARSATALICAFSASPGRICSLSAERRVIRASSGSPTTSRRTRTWPGVTVDASSTTVASTLLRMLLCTCLLYTSPGSSTETTCRTRWTICARQEKIAAHLGPCSSRSFAHQRSF